jgi:parallel beta-helix repeat protein
MLLGQALLIMVPPGRISVSAAGPIPSTINGDWVVNGNEEYDGGSCVLTGNLIVNSGGILTLRNLTLAINNGNDGEFYVLVNDGGELNIYNSTVKSQTGFKSMYMNSLGNLTVVDSTLRDFGPWFNSGVGVVMGNATIEGTTFTNNYHGLLIAWAVNLELGNCTFTNNIHFGIVFDSSASPTLYNVTVTNNGAGWANDAAIWGRLDAKPTIYGMRVRDTNGFGILLEDASAKIYNGSFNNSNHKDIRLYNEGFYNSILDLTNVSYTTRDLLRMGGSRPMQLNVFWYANISATWESDGKPVAGGDAEIFDKDEVSVWNGTLDANGEVELARIHEYKVTTQGIDRYTPHTFNVTASRQGNQFSNETSTQVINNTDIEFVLLDRLPKIDIVFPYEGYLTNNTTVEVLGYTDTGAKVWVNDVRVPVETDGEFTGVVDLTEEGKNTIEFRAQGIHGNKNWTQVNVTRDTIAPDITIESPQDGEAFNFTLIEVSGKTEAGAYLEVNGNVTPVDVNGSYSVAIEFDEGHHQVVAEATDPAGNSAMAQVSFKVDLKAPILIVNIPLDGFITNKEIIMVAGMTEIDCLVTVNGMPVELHGSTFQSNVTLIEGGNTITVQSCDPAGNCAVEVITGELDTVPPDLVIAFPAYDDMLTNQTMITIAGQTEPGVRLTRGSLEIEVAGNGSYSVDTRLWEGRNNITLEAEDLAGNTNTANRSVILDTTPPHLDITSPASGIRTNKMQIEVEGTIDKDACLAVNGDNISFSGHEFKITYDLENEGRNQLSLVATDPAGNWKKAGLDVFRDTQILLEIISPAPDTETRDEKISVSGLTDPGASITINSLNLTAKGNGSFSAEIELVDGNNNIEITAVDDVGNSKKITLLVRKLKDEPVEPPVIPGIDDETGIWWWIAAIIIIIVVAAVVAIIIMKRRKTPPAIPETGQVAQSSEE